MLAIGRNHLYRCRRFESFKNADELFVSHRNFPYPFYNILYNILRALSRNFFVLMIKIFIAALLITKSKGRWNFGLFIRRQGLTWTNHCLANACVLFGLVLFGGSIITGSCLVTRTPYTVSFFFSKRLTTAPAVTPLLLRWFVDLGWWNTILLYHCAETCSRIQREGSR